MKSRGIFAIMAAAMAGLVQRLNVKQDLRQDGIRKSMAAHGRARGSMRNSKGRFGSHRSGAKLAKKCAKFMASHPSKKAA